MTGVLSEGVSNALLSVKSAKRADPDLGRHNLGSQLASVDPSRRLSVAKAFMPHHQSASRYFPHNLDDRDEVPDSVLVEELLHAADSVLRGDGIIAGVDGACLYVGVAGVAYACWEASEVLQQEQKLQRLRREGGGATEPHPPAAPSHETPRHPPETSQESAPGQPSARSGGIGRPPPEPPGPDFHSHPAINALVPRLVRKSIDLITDAVNFVTDASDAGPHTAAPHSLLDGASGVFAAASIIYNHTTRLHPTILQRGEATVQLSQNATHALVAFCSAMPQALTCASDEVLYGRAGYLIGAQLLHSSLSACRPPRGHHFPDLNPLIYVISQVWESMLQSGRATSQRVKWQTPRVPPGVPAVHLYRYSPLMYVWHNKPHLGAGHGLAGILQALLQSLGPRGQGQPQASQEITHALGYLLMHEQDEPGRPPHSGGHFPAMLEESLLGGRADPATSPCLVQWCHGSPGVVQVLVKAHETLIDDQAFPWTSHYLEAACRAGDVVWERGLLRKGPGLCHGICGNAYALLSLYRVTGDRRWLRRARHFAAFLSTPEGRAACSTPDRPSSLWEGRAAELPLLAHLLCGRPEAARMPLYEL